ncbi:hypothetical protein LSM04_002282 [Trypanosoma melophagium]|uniref:uncharacterized protein n=1 Tax=Trypanosoma melophagium TaxID=715481 RepID=UPI00351A6FE7|nr:hypothetical protein LSM04_000657 [Trypanosoma melophagium]KAH9599714.1 hypothetical protein LSM04_002282 [Trypanosoma melophagium]
MLVSLHDSFFNVLAIPEGSKLRRDIMGSASALVRANSTVSAVDTTSGTATVALTDLFSPLTDRHGVALQHLAAMWIAAKFWGASMHQISFTSLVADLILQMENSSDKDACDSISQDTMELVNRLCNSEMILLRRCGFIVPGVSL